MKDESTREDNHAICAESTFDAHSHIGLVTTSRGVIQDVNLAAQAFFRVGRRILVGKPLLHFVARGDTRAFRDRVRELERSRVAPEPFEVQLRPRGARPCRMTLTIERIPAGFVWWAQPGAETVLSLPDAPETAQLAGRL